MLRKILRWFATAIFVVICLPIIAANIQKYLATKHWDEFLVAWGATMPDLSWLLHSTWVWVILVFSGGVSLALWVVRLWPEKKVEKPTKPESLPVIEILNHKNGSNVNFRDIVSGTISIPDSSVQVFVYSGDDFWYRQRDVVVTDNYWEVECQFGDENSSLPSQYKIAAISPAQKVPRRIAVLPSGPSITQSKEIRVVRSNE